MTWIKSHWQVIIICLLVVFSMSKCTQSCNRQINVDNITTEFNDYKTSTDSVINIYRDSINELNNSLIIANSKINMMSTMLEELKVSTDALTKINDNLSKQKTQVIIKQEVKAED